MEILNLLWRLLRQLFLMVLFGAMAIVLVAEPLTALHRRGLFLPRLDKAQYDLAINMIVGPLLVLAIVGSIAVAARFIDRRPMAHFGFRIDALWWRELAHGLLLGAALMLLVFAFEWSTGWISTTAPARTAPLFLGLAYSIVKVLCVGVYEEAFCRGYLLTNLVDAIGVAPAVFVSSAIFALLHLTNENSSLLSTVGLFVNGLLFAIAFLASGRLSTAIGLHIAWNFTEGALLGFPVSGDNEPASLLGIAQHGPQLFTGGAFGPEAGLVGIAASVIGIVWLCSMPRFARRTLAS